MLWNHGNTLIMDHTVNSNDGMWVFFDMFKSMSKTVCYASWVVYLYGFIKIKHP